jgi:hypothetical protein
MKKKEYNIEQSPFHTTKGKIRATLKELEASNGEEVVLAHKKYYKQDEYIKFIINDELDILAYDNISSLAKTLLHYILYNCLEYNTPVFRLKMASIAKILKRSDSSGLFKARNELIDIGYIAKTNTREVYWINHNKFYKGVYLVDKYIKQK